MAMLDPTKLPDEGLYNTLLKSALRDVLREVLMKTATEEVEKVIKNAESDFETSVRAYLDHSSYSQIVNYNIKLIKKDNK